MLPKKFLSNWIWMDRWEQEDTAVPHMVYFRKKYHSSEKISISANCRYKLYINGNFVQEGPQKGTAEMAYVDEARIGAYAKDGENVAAVEVLYYPEDGARRNDSLYYSPYPCLYIEDADRKKELDGKEGWKYFHAKQIQFIGEPYDPAPIHGSEIVRGEESVRGWMERDYDDSWWGEAKPYSIVDAVNPVAPFYMEKRTIPLMRHEPCCLQEVVCVREAGGREEETVKRQWNALLKEHVSVHIPAHTTQIVELSAGEEMCGYPTLALKGGRGAEVEILYSESYGIPQPDMKTLIGTRPVPPLKTDRTDFRHGCLQGTTDIYRVSGYGTDQAPERYTPYLFRTFRYIQVKITTGEQGVAILRYDYTGRWDRGRNILWNGDRKCNMYPW